MPAGRLCGAVQRANCKMESGDQKGSQGWAKELWEDHEQNGDSQRVNETPKYKRERGRLKARLC